MELNRLDGRGDYTLPCEDNERATGRVFVSKKKIVCFTVLFCILFILSAVIGTVISLKSVPASLDSEESPVANRSRKTAGGEKNVGSRPWDKARLPRNVIPLHYWITQRINMSDNIFHGQIQVKIAVKDDTVLLMLHTDPGRMIYTLINLRSSKGGNVKLESAKHRNEYLVIVTGEVLRKGKTYILTIKYNAPFSSHSRKGLYKVEHKMVYDYESKSWEARKSMAITMFFPVFARRSFPCFDEPSMKATFTLTLMYNKGFTALSNMPLRQRHVINSLFIDTFETTVKMSTYLLNYAISDYTSSESVSVNGTKISVWSPQTTSRSRQFALDATKTTLPYYESLFGPGYALPKLDMITVPDYRYAAMEHWGLINYASDRLLFSESRPNQHLMKKQAIALLISHEIVHQWFGNLVTLKWWNDIIIHEGVASYLQYFGAAKILPDYDVMDQFYNIAVRQAMAKDSLDSAKCITQAVESTKDAEINLVPLVYSKGAAILRMLHAFIGDGPFVQGFRNYLQKFAYENVEREDLWSCFSETTNVDVSSIMNSWTSQPGFPIITTSEVGNGKTLLSQRRYLSMKHSPGQYGNQTWRIPITFVTSNDPKKIRHYLLTAPNSTMEVEGDWFKLNADAAGYYIVNYDLKNWNKITEQLIQDHKVFSTLDRASIIKDTFTLAEEGLLPFTVALDATKYLKKETNWIPWQYAKHHISELVVRLPHLSTPRDKLVSYFGNISKPILAVVGWGEKSTLREQMLQETAISAALNAGDKHAVQMNKKIFQSWIHNNTYIPDNIAKVVYYYGVLNGDDKDWHIVHQRSRYEHRRDTQAMLSTALGASKNPWILTKFLQMAMYKGFSAFSNTLKIVADGSRLGQSLAWNFLKANWGTIPYGSNTAFAVNSYVVPVVEKFSSSYQYNDIKKFLTSTSPEGKLPPYAEDLLLTIKRNVEWAKNEVPHIEQWLDKYSSPKR